VGNTNLAFSASPKLSKSMGFQFIDFATGIGFAVNILELYALRAVGIEQLVLNICESHPGSALDS
jgi:hypothetical protein